MYVLTCCRVEHIAGIQHREHCSLIPEREFCTVVLVDKLGIRGINLIDFIQVVLGRHDLVGSVAHDCCRYQYVVHYHQPQRLLTYTWEVSRQSNLGSLWIDLEVDLCSKLANHCLRPRVLFYL